MKPPGPNPASRRRDLLLRAAVLASCPLTDPLSTASDAGSLSYRAAAAASTTSVEPNSVSAACPGRSWCAWLTAVVRAWSRCCCSVIALASSHPTVVPPNGGRVTASCTPPQNYTHNRSRPEDTAIRSHTTKHAKRAGRAASSKTTKPANPNSARKQNDDRRVFTERRRVAEAGRRRSTAQRVPSLPLRHFRARQST